MLTNLLHSFNPARRTASRTLTQVEADNENYHTFGLLFPENNAPLRADGASPPAPPTTSIHGGPVAGNDCNPADLDLSYPRDVRILIAQAETSAYPETILFDSKPGSSDNEISNSRPSTSSRLSSTSSADLSKPTDTSSARSHRRTGTVSESTGRRSPGLGPGAFQRSRLRNTSISSLPNIDEGSQNRVKESDELVKTALEVMFENTAAGYKGVSNKMHIVPLEPRVDENVLNSPSFSDGFSSLGRAEGRKRSQLAKSYTPADAMPETRLPSGDGIPSAARKENRRRTVMITRTFSVIVREEGNKAPDSSSERTPTVQNPSGSSSSGYPFPATSGDVDARPRPQQRTKNFLTPMYAITIVIHLPVAPNPNAHSISRSQSQRLPTHQRGASSLGSSLDSEQRGGWSLVDPYFGVDSLVSSSFSSDVDDRVDLIGQHWDIISRTLTSLQFLATEKIAAQLKPQPQASKSRSLKLQPHALAADGDLKRAANYACSRVIRGMTIQRVRTGQGRWGLWREEALWLGKWAGGKDQNFFFFNLLTAFLGHHTDWLNVLGPKWHRRRHRELQRWRAGEDLTIPNRTVIVSDDKLAARRLIFLLAAFLPASHSSHDGSASPIRPSTAASFRAYSQSPPTGPSLSRKESLRRSINRRGNPSSLRGKPLAGGRANSSSNLELADDKTETGIEVPEQFTIHRRRPSEPRAIMKSKLALTDPDPTTRKSSATTESTITPGSAIPVPHFAMQRQSSSGPPPPLERRPNSRDSVASLNLMHTLQRNDSNTSETQSQANSRWGSLRSLWSMGTRRESGTEYSDILQSTDEGQGLSGLSGLDQYGYKSKHFARPELNVDGELYQEDLQEIDSPAGGRTEDGQSEPRTPDVTGLPPIAIPQSRKKPDTTPPLKMSINQTDGVIDVELPFPDFGSPLQSPTGYISSSFGNESTDLRSGQPPSASGSAIFTSSHPFPHTLHSAHRDTDRPLNVAGWLGKFHPDFALQAIRPYQELEKDIKCAMRQEPTPMSAAMTPASETGPGDKWIDVCSTVLADTNSFSIKRLRLRRLIRLVPVPSQATTPGSSAGASAPPFRPPPTAHSHSRNQYNEVYAPSQLVPAFSMSELVLEENFVEEPIMDMDATLVDAVERILTVQSSGGSSRSQSVSSSRSSSRRGRTGAREAPTSANSSMPGGASVNGDGKEDGDRHTHSAVTATPGGLEIPRAECKGIVFGALEQVVKSIAAERSKTPTPPERAEDEHAPQHSKARVNESKLAHGQTHGYNYKNYRRHEDSTLREGVRKWLNEVEEAVR